MLSVKDGQTIVDGTTVWKVRNTRNADIPIGTIQAHMASKIPDGWLSLESGQTVSRVLYPELWSWAQANAPIISDADWVTKSKTQTSVGYYSSGDGSTTFRLPKIVDFIQGGSPTDVGSWKAPGLPNITGSIGSLPSSASNPIATGAFTWGGKTGASSYVTTSPGDKWYDPSFNASKSNSIYGNSTTIQPARPVIQRQGVTINVSNG